MSKEYNSSSIKAIIDSQKINLKRIKKEKKRLKKMSRRFVIAKKVIGEAIKISQERFQSKVDPIVQLAINAIYPERDYRFWHDAKKRGESYDWIQMISDGDEIPIEDMKSDVGGGLREIIGFALKVAFKMINKKNSRNILILDEPFPGLGSLMPMAGELIRTMSENSGMQIIMVTHSEELAMCANKTYFVDFEKKTKQSIVKEIK